MALTDIVIFIASICTLYGLYQFYWLGLLSFLYKKSEDSDISFFDFCCKEIDSLWWSLRYKYGFKPFYRSKWFKILSILKGVLSLSLGILVLVLYFYMEKSEYSNLLSYKF